MAAGLWVGGAGGPPATVIVKLFADGSVNLNMGASDIGTGTKTVMAMIVAEELGVPIEKIQIEHADTAHHAVRDRLRRQQDGAHRGARRCAPRRSTASSSSSTMAAADLKVPAAELAFRDGAVVVDPRRRPSGSRLADVSELRRRGVVVGVGYRGRNPEGKVDQPLRRAVLRGRGQPPHRRGPACCASSPPTRAAG